MRFCIYELDERQKAIGNYLESCGHIKVDSTDITKADVVILPFNNVASTIVIDNAYLSLLKPDVKVFTGVQDKVLNEKFKTNNIQLINFMDFNEIVIANSIPTAEGVLFYLLSEMKRTIFDSKALVIGFGVCGSEIANKLKGLNANVDILEVADDKKALAKRCKLNNIDLDDIYSKNYDVIINTVPMSVLTEKHLETLTKNTLIFDIASSPFGFDSEIVKDLGLSYKRILGIPSRFGVDYSGKILGEFILKHV